MSETLQLDLSVVLPAAHDERDQCVVDLVAALEHLDGVESAHVVPVDPRREPELRRFVCTLLWARCRRGRSRHRSKLPAPGSSGATVMRWFGCPVSGTRVERRR